MPERNLQTVERMSEAFEEKLQNCFDMIVLPGESADPGRTDQIFLSFQAILQFEIHLDPGDGHPVMFNLTVKDTGTGVLSNGAWSYSFGSIRDADVAKLAAVSLRDFVVLEVMCS